MKRYHTSPTLWVVWGTITISVGGSLLASLLCRLDDMSDAPLFFWTGSLSLVGAGVAFYWVSAILDHALHDTRVRLEQKEREFLWGCHSGARLSQYLDSDYEVTEGLIESCRDTMVIPDAVSDKLEAEVVCSIEQRFRAALRTSRIVGLALMLVAVALLSIEVSAWTESKPGLAEKDQAKVLDSSQEHRSGKPETAKLGNDTKGKLSTATEAPLESGEDSKQLGPNTANEEPSDGEDDYNE